VGTFAHTVLATVYEVALMIARADDPPAALSAGESAVSEFLERLLGPRWPGQRQSPSRARDQSWSRRLM
jgi:hypothetical protein